MNLLKELKATAKANGGKIAQEQDDLLQSVKDNLEISDKADMDMLKHFGVSSIIETAKADSGRQNRFISGEWLSEDDIKNVCDKYALRCLTTINYKNQVPMKALNDMRKFETDRKITLRGDEMPDPKKKGWVYPANLFIIAPRNHFTLTSRPKKDPVLLFKGEYAYEIVSTWGNDFSFLQRIKGAIQLTGYTYRTFILMLFTAYMGDLWIKNGADNIAYVLLTVFGVIGFIISVGAGISDDLFGRPKYNSQYKD